MVCELYITILVSVRVGKGGGGGEAMHQPVEDGLYVLSIYKPTGTVCTVCAL